MLDILGLGLRHGLDADHIAAISELTASERGGRVGFSAGLRYALGHAVTVGVVGAVLGASGIVVPTWVIGATLVGLGAYAAWRLATTHHHTHEHVLDDVTVQHAHRHQRRRPHRHAHASSVGLVHGLGGAPSVVLVGGRGISALVVFGLGLILANGAIGAVAGVTTKLRALAWAGVGGGIVYGAALGTGLA